jgi:hypothetical protein
VGLVKNHSLLKGETVRTSRLLFAGILVAMLAGCMTIVTQKDINRFERIAANVKATSDSAATRPDVPADIKEFLVADKDQAAGNRDWAAGKAPETQP